MHKKKIDAAVRVVNELDAISLSEGKSGSFMRKLV